MSLRLFVASLGFTFVIAASACRGSSPPGVPERSAITAAPKPVAAPAAPASLRSPGVSLASTSSSEISCDPQGEGDGGAVWCEMDGSSGH